MLCEHWSNLEPVPPRTLGCEECLRAGMDWVVSAALSKLRSCGLL